MRNWLKKNAMLVNVIASLIIVVSLAGGYFLTRSPVVQRPVVLVYYYDLNTHELFTAPPDLPPILAPSDKKDDTRPRSGALAMVYSCGNCANANEQFVGYVQVYSTRGKEIARAVDVDSSSPMQIRDAFDAADEAPLVADVSVRPITWVPNKTTRGQGVMERVTRPCEGTKQLPTQCQPSR